MGSGIGKKVGGLLERLETIEGTIPPLVESIQKLFNNVNQKMDNADQVLMAVVEILGKDVVSSKVEEIMKANALASSNQAKANLEAAVTEGKVVSSDTIGPESIIVGKEVHEDGTEVFPGRVQMMFSNFLEEIQKDLLGKKVGEVVKTTKGGTFEVQAIFEVVPQPEAAQ